MGASGGSLHKPAMSMMHAKRHELEVLPALPSEETETRFRRKLYICTRDAETITLQHYSGCNRGVNKGGIERPESTGVPKVFPDSCRKD